MTSLTIIGNLSADPELKFVNSGKAVASFTVVSSKSKKNQAGEWESTDVTFWNIKAWDKLAENICDTLRKGMGVIVQGSAVQESWEDKNTGQQRFRIVVTAWNVGVDLKRHTYQVTAVTRNQEGDYEVDPWTQPAWQNTPKPQEDFPF